MSRRESKSSSRTYTGPKSDHFDGERFFDPHGAPPKSLREVLRWQFGGGRQRAKWPDWVENAASDTPPPHDFNASSAEQGASSQAQDSTAN